MGIQEKELVQRSKAGEIEAFEQLIYDYEKRAYNIALRIMGNEEDAKDMAQEAFIRVYKSIRDFKEQSAFSTWLYRIVTNVCLDEMRKRKKEKTIPLDGSQEGGLYDAYAVSMSDKEQPESIYEQTEQNKIIMEAISELSEEYKAAIILRDVQGFSYDEISNILTCSQGTVKSRISRGRNILKDKLKARLELSYKIDV